MMFLSGAFWTAHKVNKIEDKPSAKLLVWSIGLFTIGLYFLISIIGVRG
jgi:hypothetical protein